MNNKVRSHSSLYAGIALFLTLLHSPLYAGVINTHFFDLGASTIDKASNLEWLDLSTTRGLSVNQITSDLETTGGIFEPKDNWRYATLDDFYGLTSRWFSIDYNGGVASFDSNNSALVDLFISTFGDTLDQAFDDWSSVLDAAEDEHASAIGILGNRDSDDTPYSSAHVNDNHLINRRSGKLRSNDQDSIIDGFRIDSSIANLTHGHYLIRDYQSTPIQVSEPSTLAIFMLGLLILCVKRRGVRSL